MMRWPLVLLVVCLCACSRLPASTTNRGVTTTNPRGPSDTLDAESPVSATGGTGGATSGSARSLAGNCDALSHVHDLASRLAVELPPHWTVLAQGQELVFRGPETVFTQCEYGADASEFSCRDVHGPAQYFVRVTLRSTFECPDVPQSSIHMAGRMPWFQDACFHYSFRHASGVSAYEHVELKGPDVMAAVEGAVQGTRARLTCPGF